MLESEKKREQNLYRTNLAAEGAVALGDDHQGLGLDQLLHQLLTSQRHPALQNKICEK